MNEYMRRYRATHPEYVRKDLQARKERGDSKKWKQRNTAKVKLWAKEDNARRFTFKGKRIFVNTIPRKGICTKCGKKGRTSLHHTEYDLNNPMAHTIEICQACHLGEHGYLLQYRGELCKDG